MSLSPSSSWISPFSGRQTSRWLSCIDCSANNVVIWWRYFGWFTCFYERTLIFKSFKPFLVHFSFIARAANSQLNRLYSDVMFSYHNNWLGLKVHNLSPQYFSIRLIWLIFLHPFYYIMITVTSIWQDAGLVYYDGPVSILDHSPRSYWTTMDSVTEVGGFLIYTCMARQKQIEYNSVFNIRQIQVYNTFQWILQASVVLSGRVSLVISTLQSTTVMTNASRLWYMRRKETSDAIDVAADSGLLFGSWHTQSVTSAFPLCFSLCTSYQSTERR